MSDSGEGKKKHEVLHGKKLAGEDPEFVWGWGTPAGSLRAQRRAQLIMEGAGLQPGILALEVGCGSGLFTEKFVESGARILAIDISSDLLEIARARNLPAESALFVNQGIEDLDTDLQFDAVIGSSVLHHIDLNLGLKKIWSVLKPGGSMAFAEPNLLNPQVFMERKLRRFVPRFWYVSEDETAFVRWMFADVLSKAGFEEVRITPFDWLHPLTPRSLIEITSTVGRWLERSPVLREFAGSLFIHCRRPMEAR